MSARTLVVVVALGAAGSAAPSATAVREPLPASALAVKTETGWREWWRAGTAPARWTGPDPRLTDELRWQAGRPGVEWAEATLAGSGEAWRTRLVVARIDPAVIELSLEEAATGIGRPAWSVDRLSGDVAVAVNAGQFLRTAPWGWVVTNGRERLGPGAGPLVTALVVDSAGAIRWITGPVDSARAARPRLAFQSYPTLLTGDGAVPEPVRAPGRGIDVHHRDARLAIGEARDGTILIALTRFDGLGATLGFVPFGLTIPEMAAVMGALGAHTAMALDGGISGQLLVDTPDGPHTWTGLRRVPLGLVGRVVPAAEREVRAGR